MDGLHKSDDGYIFPVRGGRGNSRYNISSFKAHGIHSVSSAFKWDRKNNICKYCYILAKEHMHPIVPKKALL